MENKKLLFIALAMGMMGCTKTNKNAILHHVDVFVNPLQELQVDGCTYLFKEHDRGAIFTHKGNCNNPIHIHNGGNNE